MSSGLTSSAPTSGRASLGFARLLSWITMGLILLSSLVISVIIANSARDTLLEKQKDYALLMAENLNHQIYQRYALPLVIGGRGLSLLDQTTRFEPLEDIVPPLLHGLRVYDLRIYSHNSTITYAINSELIGDKGLASPEVAGVRLTDVPAYTIESTIPFWKALFMFHLPPGSFTLRTTYPLRLETRLLSFENDGPTLDVLEFSQDITEDYRIVIGFQWLIIATTFISSMMLFSLLWFFIKRADRILFERMQETQRLERKLHQHEKLAGMGRVVSSIAHELRNPLGIIRSSAELLLHKTPDTDSSKGLLAAIYDESCRLSQTITDFLDYARPKTPRRDAVDMAVILDQALAFLGNSLAEQEITLAKSVSGNSTVPGDKDLLYRALYNVLINASQAGGRGAAIMVDMREKNSHVVISVTDSGPGFDLAQLDKYLDPFFTTKDGGTGLGLPIVQSIITSHDGTVEIGNDPQGTGGAKVVMTLPTSVPDGE